MRASRGMTKERRVADDLIGYERLTREALRTVVRAAISRAAGPNGLPGRHHFYVTFRTRAPGVSVPEHLAQRYPDEMTIVIEHQFWDLEVHPDRFSVILKFQGQPYTVVVPMGAITRFYDPSVRFALHFDDHDLELATPINNDAEDPSGDADDSTDTPAGAVVSLDAFRRK